MEPWLSKLQADKKKERVIGRQVRVKMRKNHITGKKREVTTWIYDGYGIQDAKSCLEFLVKEGKVSKLGGWIQWDGSKYQMDNLLKLFSKDPVHMEELLRLTQETWNDIEESLQPEWSPRYE